MILAPRAMADVLLQCIVGSHFFLGEALIGATAEGWHNLSVGATSKK